MEIKYVSASDPIVWSKMQYRPILDSEEINVVIENPDFRYAAEEPVPTNRILYTATTRPESTWIELNCSENHFENGEGYLVLNPDVTELVGWPDSETNVVYTVFLDITDASDMNDNIKEIIIPNSITNIGFYAFAGCLGVTEFVIPNSVTSIGDGAFYCCTSLTSITIPNSVTGIGFFTFAACSSLTSINIPTSITEIGEEAFVLSGLTSVTCNWVNSNDIPNISGKNVFNNTSENLVINIPQEANPQDYIDNGWPRPTSPNMLRYTATTQPESD